MATTARKKVALDCRLNSWGDVDEAMRQVAERERVIADLNNNMNMELDEIKARYAALAKPVHEQIDHYSADICQFVTEHRGDMEGKTKELNFGRTGFRLSTRLKYHKGIKAADVVAALLQRGLAECVKTTQTVVADRLKQQPLEVLDQIGAYLDRRDEFWVEVKQEDLQPSKAPEEGQ